jgi:hypothetical protein
VNSHLKMSTWNTDKWHSILCLSLSVRFLLHHFSCVHFYDESVMSGMRKSRMRERKELDHPFLVTHSWYFVHIMSRSVRYTLGMSKMFLIGLLQCQSLVHMMFPIRMGCFGSLRLFDIAFAYRSLCHALFSTHVATFAPGFRM